MPKLLDLSQLPGERLDATSYVADFDARFWRIGGEGLWKLECLQNYQENGFASWEAFRVGDWDGALRLVEELRPGFEEYYDRISAHGFRIHRVRVIQEPITPYVQWEMQILRSREQCGEAVTVLTAGQAAALAGPAPLPDIVTLGAEAGGVRDPLHRGRDPRRRHPAHRCRGDQGHARLHPATARLGRAAGDLLPAAHCQPCGPTGLNREAHGVRSTLRIRLRSPLT